LPEGVDTLLGERGTGLSEGQMQRISIARAVFSASPILLLDESTSALDAETERRLLENLRAMTDKTVVIVTHRPAALDICDRIFRFTPEGVTTV
ncbi:MAG: ATP-binding cassette domain-containing protein, partial [Oscillospiraceae bacterium]|nr:ATP-binding cassette domain-containing protein [Oscillospiraceae bacterium]